MKNKLLYISLGALLSFTGAHPALAASAQDLMATATKVILRSIDFLAQVAGAVIVLMIIWGGFKYIQGDQDGGKKTLVAAFIGAVIILFANIIVQTLQTLAETSS